MVLCATQFEMEKQFQLVYTISKFREVEIEFTMKVYCDIISTAERCLGTTHEVREVVTFEGCRRKKILRLISEREMWYYLHLSLIRVSRNNMWTCERSMIRNDVTWLSKKYILWRWRRDVNRAHTGVAANYDGLVTTSDSWDTIICAKLLDRWLTLLQMMNIGHVR